MIGLSGVSAHVLAVVEYQFNNENVIILCQQMVARFVLVRERNMRFAILSLVPKMNPVFGQNNARSIIIKRIRVNSTNGCLTLINVSSF